MKIESAGGPTLRTPQSLCFSRRAVLRCAALGLPFAPLAGTGLGAAPTTNSAHPGKTWERFPNPDVAGFRSSALEAMETTLYSKPTTTLMVVKAAKIAYAYGDVGQVSNIMSVRKSILSVLYGRYVENGAIDLNRTIGDLNINERGEGLLSIEKTATLRDLLMSSSGVYWPAGSPSGSNLAPPPRGSKKPGSYFFYNNWDFNVAGAVFEKLTGKSVFQALAEDLAEPLQFEDFTPERQRMLGYPTEPSRYKSYQMFLSSRDMARLGVLMANAGFWKGRQLIPSSWIKESTGLRVKAADMANGNGALGYAYMWWKPSESRKGAEWADSYLAYGNYGQFILVLPAIDTVIVHKRAITDEFAIALNTGKTQATPAGGPFTAVDFLQIADAIVAAQRKG
jgi:CubicO group peptidase (beta-lactamase class C family)